MYGFNPGFSNTITGIQAGLAGLNGVVDILNAKNNGVNTCSAVSYGLSNASLGVANAFLGNMINYDTHSYLGTTMNGFMSSLGMDNCSTAFGLCALGSTWASPFRFGGGMPWTCSSPFILGGGMPGVCGFSWFC